MEQSYAEPGRMIDLRRDAGWNFERPIRVGDRFTYNQELRGFRRFWAKLRGRSTSVLCEYVVQAVFP